MSSPIEQNGMKEEGEGAPLSSMICTGWFITLGKSLTPMVRVFLKILRIKEITYASDTCEAF